MSELKIGTANSLSLPLDAVTQKFAILGRTGSGKSYCATKLCEEMLTAGAQVIALDPVGVWYGLRIGRRQSGSDHFSIRIFGGLHGDMPLEHGAGQFMADLIVDRGISAVLDVSQFESDAQKARFAEAFATRFFFRKKSSPSAVHLFLEEAQEFVPQNPQRDEAMMLHAFHRIAKLGRNFGIGATLITQRPQEVNKKALNQTECLFAFQMTGPQERKAIESWIAEKGVNEDIVSVLPHLKVGTCHVWSPQWLKVSKTVTIAKKKTADVSSTPSAGESRKAEPQPLSDDELIELTKSMAATVERAKAEDPRELRKEIEYHKKQSLDAMRQLAGERARFEKGHIEIKRVEVPVLTEAEIARVEKLSGQLLLLRAKQQEALDKLVGKIAEQLAPIHAALSKLQPNGANSPRTVPVLMQANAGEAARLANSRPPAQAARPADDNGELRITSKQQQILDALAWYESIGNLSPTPVQVGAIALIDGTGGHFSNTVGPLSTHGLITRAPGRIALTDKGREFASVPERVATLADYHNLLRDRVRRAKSANGATIKILDVILSRGGAQLTTEEIGREVPMDHTGGHFSNTIGPLGTLGFIERAKGVVRPTEVLFPPGLS